VFILHSGYVANLKSFLEKTYNVFVINSKQINRLSKLRC